MRQSNLSCLMRPPWQRVYSCYSFFSRGNSMSYSMHAVRATSTLSKSSRRLALKHSQLTPSLQSRRCPLVARSLPLTSSSGDHMFTSCGSLILWTGRAIGLSLSICFAKFFLCRGSGLCRAVSITAVVANNLRVLPSTAKFPDSHARRLL